MKMEAGMWCFSPQKVNGLIYWNYCTKQLCHGIRARCCLLCFLNFQIKDWMEGTRSKQPPEELHLPAAGKGSPGRSPQEIFCGGASSFSSWVCILCWNNLWLVTWQREPGLSSTGNGIICSQAQVSFHRSNANRYLYETTRGRKEGSHADSGEGLVVL